MSVTAEGAYFSKGIQTVIKAEDPEYLDVVDYFVNLEGRLTLMRDNVARLSRAYMTLGSLWGEFGAQAVAVGATEEESGLSGGARGAVSAGASGGAAGASGKGKVNSELSHAFLQLGDAAESLRAPWVKHTKGMMQMLISRICEYLLVVRLTFPPFEQELTEFTVCPWSAVSAKEGSETRNVKHEHTLATPRQATKPNVIVNQETPSAPLLRPLPWIDICRGRPGR
jgi:hypothetical protein